MSFQTRSAGVKALTCNQGGLSEKQEDYGRHKEKKNVFSAKERIKIFQIAIKNTQKSQGEKVNSEYLLMKDIFQVQRCLSVHFSIILILVIAFSILQSLSFLLA